MRRNELKVGTTYVVTDKGYNAVGVARVELLTVGALYCHCLVVDPTKPGAPSKVWLHPSELEALPAPNPKPRVFIGVDLGAAFAGVPQEVSGGTVARKLEAVLPQPTVGKRTLVALQSRMPPLDITQADAEAERAGDPPRHKWNTPGRHTITSYRSFRRYKAAGASFGVIPFNSSNRQPEKELVNISVSMARRRAQAGLALIAVVSA